MFYLKISNSFFSLKTFLVPRFALESSLRSWWNENWKLHIRLVTFRCFCHIVFRSATLDLRSFRARLLSASLSLLAANSSWRLAMLFSGMSSLSLFKSCNWQDRYRATELYGPKLNIKYLCRKLWHQRLFYRLFSYLNEAKISQVVWWFDLPFD